MTRRIAVVFIDSLPPDAAERLAVPGAEWRPMRAGLGYSVNAKAELFAGLVPDDLGLLNEYSLVGEPSWTPRALLAPLDRFPRASWLVRRGLRLLTGGQVENIPFGQRRFFERRGVTAYSTGFPHRTVLDAVDARVLYTDVTARDRDAVVAQRLLTALDGSASTFFGAFPDLDRTLHETGFDGPGYAARLAFYAPLLRQVAERVDDLVIVSDHGMAPVRRTIDVVEPLRRLGDRHLLSFVDSTMVRLWCCSGRPEGLTALRDDLGLLELDEQERGRFGVRSRDFGDVVLLAPEGAVLSPNSYGRFRSFRPGATAMHGYHPSSAAQVGVLGGTGSWTAELGEDEWGTLQVHALLRRLLPEPPGT